MPGEGVESGRRAEHLEGLGAELVVSLGPVFLPMQWARPRVTLADLGGSQVCAAPGKASTWRSRSLAICAIWNGT